MTTSPLALGLVVVLALPSAGFGQDRAPPPTPLSRVSITGEAPEGFADAADGVLREIEAWRGLRFRHDVKVEFIAPPEAAGDAKGPAGWYEPDSKRLVVVGRGTVRFQRGTMLHELFHALQDQHFALATMPRATPDAVRAVEALIEGEAMLAVAELLHYDFRQHATFEDEGPLDPARFKKIFDYGTGQDAIRTLRRRGGWASVDRTFKNPPATTAEIYRLAEARESDALDLPPGEAPRFPAPPEAKGVQYDDLPPAGAYAFRLALALPPSRRHRALELGKGYLGDRRVRVRGPGSERPRLRWTIAHAEAASVAELWSREGSHGRVVETRPDSLTIELPEEL